MSGIWWMSATIGVTSIGPMMGSCCRNASGGVGVMATTSVGMGGAGAAEGASVTRLFVTGLLALLSMGGVPRVSRRAAANIVHAAGGSTGGGVVGWPPANGLSSAFARLDTATVVLSACFVSGGFAGSGRTAFSVTDARPRVR
jgi:hypothetical protein